MEFEHVADVAKKWNLSERTVRNYCAKGEIAGAILVGKTWNIPVGAVLPAHKTNLLLNILKEQKLAKLTGGIYHKVQVLLTYNSNHIEGSTLTEEQTRFIFDTNTLGLENATVDVDDIVETSNHFKCVDFVIDNATKPLSVKMIKHLHFLLKSCTSDASKEWFAVGDFKKLPNEVAGRPTTKPENVKKEIDALLKKYNAKHNKSFEDIVEFHKQFETIHPFQDGNGRVGRLIILKECLANRIVPFVIDEKHKLFYYRGLKEWESEHGFLLETCLSCQDEFKQWLDYFEIDY